MGESLAGTSRAAPQKQEKSVPPGNITVGISVGLLVGPYVKERFKEIGKAR